MPNQTINHALQQRIKTGQDLLPVEEEGQPLPPFPISAYQAWYAVTQDFLRRKLGPDSAVRELFELRVGQVKEQRIALKMQLEVLEALSLAPELIPEQVVPVLPIAPPPAVAQANTRKG